MPLRERWRTLGALEGHKAKQLLSIQKIFVEVHIIERTKLGEVPRKLYWITGDTDTFLLYLSRFYMSIYLTHSLTHSLTPSLAIYLSIYIYVSSLHLSFFSPFVPLVRLRLWALSRQVFGFWGKDLSAPVNPLFHLQARKSSKHSKAQDLAGIPLLASSRKLQEFWCIWAIARTLWKILGNSVEFSGVSCGVLEKFSGFRRFRAIWGLERLLRKHTTHPSDSSSSPLHQVISTLHVQ